MVTVKYYAKNYMLVYINITNRGTLVVGCANKKKTMPFISSTTLYKEDFG